MAALKNALILGKIFRAKQKLRAFSFSEENNRPRNQPEANRPTFCVLFRELSDAH